MASNPERRRLLEHLPSVQWKLLNLSKMDEKKHRQAAEKLKEVLFNDKT